jgi:hypothetical protein
MEAKQEQDFCSCGHWRRDHEEDGPCHFESTVEGEPFYCPCSEFELEEQLEAGVIQDLPAKIRRWQLTEGSSVELSGIGRFVDRADYKKLESKSAALHAEIAKLSTRCEEYTASGTKAAEELAKVRAVLSVLEDLYDCREQQLGQAAEELAKVREESAKEAEKLKSRRVHTQEWYASHYAKLQDWARKVLPEPYRNQFFSCIANGTYDVTLDRGEPYMCNAGFMVTPSGYIHMDDAKGQLILDQTHRAEEAESELARERERHQDLRQVVNGYRTKLWHGTYCGHYYAHDPCLICTKADALLADKAEPKPAPVVTNTGEEK